jgi:hypothetical protein
MSRDEQRRRIPTSDELEEQGALTPAADPTAQRQGGGLLRFFRTGRFRVSDDVAARKHVGVAQARPPVTASEGEAPQEAAVMSPLPLGAPVRPADAIVPRKIRIDPSVKERRGLGRSSEADHRGPVLRQRA